MDRDESFDVILGHPGFDTLGQLDTMVNFFGAQYVDGDQAIPSPGPPRTHRG
jgi:hypothetical protein